jgi:hypothetical protein
MDLRPLVPWVLSQLGDQPDGTGRPYRKMPRRVPAGVAQRVHVSRPPPAPPLVVMITIRWLGRNALAAGRHANNHGLTVAHLRIVYDKGKIFISH